MQRRAALKIPREFGEYGAAPDPKGHAAAPPAKPAVLMEPDAKRPPRLSEIHRERSTLFPFR